VVGRLNNSASAIDFCTGVLSPLTFCLFSENTLHERVAPLPLFSSKLTIKYLSSTGDPIAAKQIYTMPDLCRRYQRIFIQQFNHFTWLKSKFTQLHLPKFLCKSDNFLRRQKETKVGDLFLLKLHVHESSPDNLQIPMVVKFLQLLFFLPSI